jgi:hypothetical protein
MTARGLVLDAQEADPTRRHPRGQGRHVVARGREMQPVAGAPRGRIAALPGIAVRLGIAERAQVPVLDARLLESAGERGLGKAPAA